MPILEIMHDPHFTEIRADKNTLIQLKTAINDALMDHFGHFEYETDIGSGGIAHVHIYCVEDQSQ